MDKVKKFVIFPISLLVIELILQYNYSNLDYWKYLFINNANFPWQRILLGILAILLYILGIAVLFVWVFDTVSLKSLLNRSTAKGVGIAFAIDYLVILLVEPMLYSLVSHLYRDDITPWVFILSNALVMTTKAFFVISMILWFVLKPLRGRFRFRTKTFFIAALSCLLLYVLFNYVNMQISLAALASLKANPTENAMDYLNLLISSDNYSKFQKMIGLIVYTIQDVIILVFINSCIKNKNKVEIQDV